MGSFDISCGASMEPASTEPAALAEAEKELEARRSQFTQHLASLEQTHDVVLRYSRSGGFLRRAALLAGHLGRVCEVQVGDAPEPAGPATGAFEVLVRQRAGDPLVLIHSKLGGDGFVDSVPKLQRIITAVASSPAAAACDLELWLASAHNFQGLVLEKLAPLPQDDPAKFVQPP